MNRRDLVEHIEEHGCYRERENISHTVYRNSTLSRCVTVPRHEELKDSVVRVICRELAIPVPR